MHALLPLLATTAALSATSSAPVAKQGNEAALAAVATPLKPSKDLGQVLLRDGVARGREGAGRGDVCCERVFDQEVGVAVECQRRGRADAEAARDASAGAHGVVSERVSRSMYKAAR